MATISENLQTIKDSTAAIKQAIIDKGGTISGDITTWASVINAIDTGGSSGAGSVFKITNKLNGQLFGGYQYMNDVVFGEIVHNYLFEGGILESMILVPVNTTVVEGYAFPYSGSGRIGSASSEENTGLPYVYINNGGAGATTRCGRVEVRLCIDGTLVFVGFEDGILSVEPAPLEVALIVFDTNKNYDIDFFKVQSGGPCFVKDTLITLSNNSTKPVQDVTYNDELLVWNFDEGKYDKAKPLWIKKTQMSSYYYRCELDNGTILNLVGSNGKCHRLFSIEDGMFLSATDMVGKMTYTENGIAKVVSCERVEKEVEFYNIITKYHMNLFANGVLTSCRYNNIYPIKDMKFIKDDRLSRAPKWKLYEQFREHRVLNRYNDSLRLYEQLDIPLENTIKYCENLERLRKNIDDFDKNKDLVKDIENTEVGWIDREGNVYGLRLYMAGHYNHIILADKICRELGINTDNPSRYLEKLGWVKYTTDFVLNSDDEYINKNQLDVIKKFVKIPRKLKTEGYIKIGTAFDAPTSINDFENMDEYSFEFRKRNSKKIWQQDK